MSLYLIIHNLSDPTQPIPEVCDYEWWAQINERVLAAGVVREHARADGWIALAKRVMADAERGAERVDVARRVLGEASPRHAIANKMPLTNP